MLQLTDSVSVPDQAHRIGDGITTLWSYGIEVGKELLIVGFVAGWVLLWGATARIHYSQGDMAALSITVLLFVLPAIGLLGWRLTRKFGGGL